LEVGVGSQGIVLFRFGNRINSFCWSRIVKICFKRRQFFVQMRKEDDDLSGEKDNVVCFNLSSYSQCKAIWKSCVEHHTFFRLQTPRPQTKKFLFFFTFGSRFRYRSVHLIVFIFIFYSFFFVLKWKDGISNIGRKSSTSQVKSHFCS
jgi:tyrosine-protein phosphatase non-receptor type 4